MSRWQGILYDAAMVLFIAAGTWAFLHLNKEPPALVLDAPGHAHGQAFLPIDVSAARFHPDVAWLAPNYPFDDPIGRFDYFVPDDQEVSEEWDLHLHG